MRTTSRCIEAMSWIWNAVMQLGWLWAIIHFLGLLLLSVKSTAKLPQGSAVRGTEPQKMRLFFLRLLSRGQITETKLHIFKIQCGLD